MNSAIMAEDIDSRGHLLAYYGERSSDYFGQL